MIAGRAQRRPLARSEAGLAQRPSSALVTARVPEAERERAEAILERNSVNIRDRGAAYRKSGWKGYNPSAPAYTADQVRRERNLPPHGRVNLGGGLSRGRLTKRGATIFAARRTKSAPSASG